MGLGTVFTNNKIWAGALALTVLLAPRVTNAVPSAGAAQIRKQVQHQAGPFRPSVMVHQDSLREFETLIGQQLTSSDLSQLQRTMDGIDELNRGLDERAFGDARVQNVRWDIGKTGYEFTLLICGHLRSDINTVIPQSAKDKLGKVPPFFRDKIQGLVNRGNVDIMPCFDPHTGLSYVMLGIGGSSSNNSLLTAGVSVGVYFAPKSEKMVVGNYVFGRASMSLGGIAKWDALTAGADLNCADGAWNLLTTFKVDFSKCNRAFLSTGVSFDLGAGIIGKLRQRFKGIPPQPGEGTTVNLGMWSFSGGVVVKMHEFPWYDRLRKGMSFRETFSDVDQYIAANN